MQKAIYRTVGIEGLYLKILKLKKKKEEVQS